MQSNSQASNQPEDRPETDEDGVPNTIPSEPGLKPEVTQSAGYSTEIPTEQAISELTETVSTNGSRPSGKPAFEGPDGVLWAGFLTFILIVLGMTLWMMRGRARRQARLREADKKEFFQPAGEDAEITFEESHDSGNLNTAETFALAPDQKLESEDNYSSENFDHAEETEEKIEQPKKKGHPFANLFAKKRRESEIEEQDYMLGEFEGPALDVLEEDDEGLATVVIESSADDLESDVNHTPLEALEHTEPTEQTGEQEPIDYRAAELAEERWRLEEEAKKAEAEARRAEADARRMAEEERSRQQAALEEREQRIRDEERRLSERFDAISQRSAINEQTIATASTAVPAALFSAEKEAPQAVNDDSGFHAALIDIEEALLAQSETLKAETQNLLTAFADRFERRLAEITPSVDAHTINQLSDIDHNRHNIIADTITENVTRQLNEHRQAIDTALNRLSVRIDNISIPEDAAGLRTELSAVRGVLGVRALGPLAPMVQLNDILQNALPPNAYELNASLGNNRKTDCLIALPHPPGPIAIDARFPVEAFDELYKHVEIDKTRAESEFRRAVLRHIVDIAERQIVPDRTADSAIMFIPSETMYTDLHAQFPDVVQDGYRARVWIVSPTTLMATLHTIRAIMQDARSRENAAFIQGEAREVLGEVENLRDRVTNLETHFDRARDDVRNLVSSTNQVYRRAETISRSQTNAGEHQSTPNASTTIPPQNISTNISRTPPNRQNGPDSDEDGGAAKSINPYRKSTPDQSRFYEEQRPYPARAKDDQDDHPGFPLR